ncbi:MAG: sensor histidine kinase [Terriglobales bacterium]
MKSPFGSRIAPAIYIAVAVLLAAVAVVQYRWSARVAAADAQREREHLDTAASLFANELNDTVGQAVEFMQEDAQRALKSGERLAAPPKLIGELDYVDATAAGTRKVKRLSADGYFVDSSPPAWMPAPACTVGVLLDPPALVSPILDITQLKQGAVHAVRIFQAFGRDRCLVGRIDVEYLRTTLFPQLLQKSFGESAWKDYEFAVTQPQRPQRPIYGSVWAPDIRRPISPVPAIRLRRPGNPALSAPEPHENTFFVQRYESVVVQGGTAPNPAVLGKNIWELDIRHKGIPLAESFERTRRRDLFLSIAVEALLGAAIVFLVIGVRRMQRLAEQKMEFVAGVSHELRAPVSAIAMLSRNQADGLVSGAEKVRQYGELMNQQSRRLNEMVEQTLQYAGIHSNLARPSKTEIDLKRLIQEVVDARREELERRGFELEVNTSADLPAVQGDPNLLRIAIDNLLSNAGKYAEAGHWIRVSANFAPSEKEILISVEDRGPGIAPGEQANIFEPFTRGQAAIDAQIPGSGIGLSLVRSAAEAHRGTITLASEPGTGSKFTLHLPV